MSHSKKQKATSKDGSPKQPGRTEVRAKIATIEVAVFACCRCKQELALPQIVEAIKIGRRADLNCPHCAMALGVFLPRVMTRDELKQAGVLK